MSSREKRKDAPVLEQALEKHLHNHQPPAASDEKPAEAAPPGAPAQYEKPWREYWTAKQDGNRNNGWNWNRLFVVFRWFR